jgi:peptide/nickel transport system permease protein
LACSRRRHSGQTSRRGGSGAGRPLVWRSRDLQLAQRVVLLTTGMFVLVNLAVDLLYTCVDPQIRYS